MGDKKYTMLKGTCTFCGDEGVFSRHFSAIHGLKLRDHAQSLGLKSTRAGSCYRCVHCSRVLQGPFDLADHLDRWHLDKLGVLKGMPPEPAPVTNQPPLVIRDSQTAQVIEQLDQTLTERDATIQSLHETIAKLEASLRDAEDAKAQPVPLSAGASERIMGILKHLRP
jgi:uncharacterized coiled-coil protein SlyX/ribosomal protein S27AE